MWEVSSGRVLHVVDTFFQCSFYRLVHEPVPLYHSFLLSISKAWGLINKTEQCNIAAYFSPNQWCTCSSANCWCLLATIWCITAGGGMNWATEVECIHYHTIVIIYSLKKHLYRYVCNIDKYICQSIKLHLKYSVFFI